MWKAQLFHSIMLSSNQIKIGMSSSKGSEFYRSLFQILSGYHTSEECDGVINHFDSSIDAGTKRILTEYE